MRCRTDGFYGGIKITLSTINLLNVDTLIILGVMTMNVDKKDDKSDKKSSSKKSKDDKK